MFPTTVASRRRNLFFPNKKLEDRQAGANRIAEEEREEDLARQHTVSHLGLWPFSAVNIILCCFLIPVLPSFTSQ